MDASLAPVFRSAAERLEANRPALNQADPYNGNHGDHMVEIFQTAASAAGEISLEDLPAALESAARRLAVLEGNGTAQVYARGLTQFASQFRRYGIQMNDLTSYVQGLLRQEGNNAAQPPSPAAGGPGVKSGDILKALVAGLEGWQKSEAGEPTEANGGKLLDMGYLFDLGVAYMQAKQRNATKAETIADAAAEVSPLGKVPHRRTSGKLALQALLEAMAR